MRTTRKRTGHDQDRSERNHKDHRSHDEFGDLHWSFSGAWPGPWLPCRPAPHETKIEFRSFDGSGNNRADADQNAAGATFTRIGPAFFADGISELRDGPNPRTISNVVVGEGDPNVANPQGLSAFMYAWGQFIDHDLTLTRSDGANHIDIAVPDGDPVFGDDAVITMTRAVIDPATGPGTAAPSAPLNFTTGWLDGSMVYGPDAATAASLRLADGHMKTSPGDNLPVAGGAFAAGDPRAAENFALTALHTLFVREHNYQVDRLHEQHPTWSGDKLYQYARAIVAAEIANITYSEFLPALLGNAAIAPYQGYDPAAAASLSLEFNIAYRFGHSLVSEETESLAENGEVVAGSERELKDIFFAPPSDFVAAGGTDGQLRHLAADPSQAMDIRIVDALRNFLFDPPAASDLAAINIQREHDFGIGTLNEVRASVGLAPYATFEQITSDAGTLAALRTAFDNDIDAVDFWTGGLSEASAPGALVGETFQIIIAAQFEALRDGDRFWFENQGFNARTLAEIKGTTLADIILRNTDTQHIQDDAFVTYTRHTGLAGGVEPEDPAARQLVIGSDGTDTLIGGPQGDYLFAGTGIQTMTGLDGADKFVIGKGPTQAKITDFEPGIDTIVFADAGSLDWRDVSIKSSHGHAVVHAGNDRIELVGVNPYELSRYDFLFDT